MTTFAVAWEADIPAELGGGRDDVVARRAHDRVVAELREERDGLRAEVARLEADLTATIAAVEDDPRPAASMVLLGEDETSVLDELAVEAPRMVAMGGLAASLTEPSRSRRLAIALLSLRSLGLVERAGESWRATDTGVGLWATRTEAMSDV